MNLHVSKCNAAPVTCALSEPRRRKEDGFAVLVILILMSLMLVFLASNAIVLRHLHQQIKLVEKRQLKKFDAAPVKALVQTNATNVGQEKRPE